MQWLSLRAEKMIDRLNSARPPRGIRIILFFILAIPCAIILTNAYFAFHPEFNLRWMEPWSVQVTAHNGETYIFINAKKMVKLRGLLISNSTRATGHFNYLIKVSDRDEIRLVSLNSGGRGVRFSSEDSHIFIFAARNYLYEFRSARGPAKLYEYRDGNFSAVPGNEADELLKNTKFDPRRALLLDSYPGDRLLELSGHRWINGENVFEWQNSRFKFKKSVDVIKLICYTPSSKSEALSDVDQSIRLPGGLVFQYSRVNCGIGKQGRRIK